MRFRWTNKENEGENERKIEKCVSVNQEECMNTDRLTTRLTNGQNRSGRHHNVRALYLLYHDAVIWLLVSFIEYSKNECERQIGISTSSNSFESEYKNDESDLLNREVIIINSHTHIHANLHTYSYISEHVNTLIHAHAHTHTHTHTHTLTVTHSEP